MVLYSGVLPRILRTLVYTSAAVRWLSDRVGRWDRVCEPRHCTSSQPRRSTTPALWTDAERWNCYMRRLVNTRRLTHAIYAGPGSGWSSMQYYKYWSGNRSSRGNDRLSGLMFCICICRRRQCSPNALEPCTSALRSSCSTYQRPVCMSG
ncbi:hypothetical protein BDW22DRAFT_353158 [Trametopsis cervina]|nr:hypothetical protein BDW22DRAFT_353158 [Trametopsis cervina]